MNYPLALISAAITFVGVVGCGSDDADDLSSDNTGGTGGTPQFTEPSREERIESLARAACARYADEAAGCPGYGTGDDQVYQTAADCERDFEGRASDLWPNDECGQGQINPGRYDVCEDRAQLAACSQNLFDSIGALAECNADEVCTDPATASN